MTANDAMRILVVDDNDASAKTLAWTAEFLGYEVRMASTGQNAIRMAKEFLPHIVLLDITLPDITGYEVCEEMRKQPELRDTVYIAQTGWDQNEHVARSKAAGFHHHLVKPIHLKTLQEVLGSINPAHA